MNKGPPHNIFDVASKKKPLPSKKQVNSPPPSESIAKIEAEKIPQLDIETVFARIMEMQKDLEQKSHELREVILSSPQKVIQFFSDSKNFTPEQWNIIQNNRKELEAKAWSVIGKDPKKATEKRHEEKNTKQRKGKSLGERHGWISMH